jgi:hypothetical protein
MKEPRLELKIGARVEATDGSFVSIRQSYIGLTN